MGALFFSPIGRIGPDTFRQGAVALLIANIILWMGWKISLGTGTIAMFIALASIYCWGCLYVKRFHDAGKSGTFFAPVLIGFGVISYVLGSSIVTAIYPELLTVMQDLQENVDFYNSDIDVVFPIYRRVFGTISLPFAVAYALVGGAFAFGLNSILPSDPNDNVWGPKTE